MVPGGLGARTVTGLVTHTEPRGGRQRIVLEGAQIQGLDGPRRRIRVTIPSPPEPLLHKRVTMTAEVGPFSGPVKPGGYDFARAAAFRELDGTGFSYGHPKVLEPVKALPWTQRVYGAVLRARLHLAERAQAAWEGGGSGMAVALVTGLRGVTAEEDAEALRASGLGHLLAISGLHMGLVAGTAFVAVRLIAASWPWLALRISTKKLAAVAALAAATAYLILSGAPVSARRAYIMSALVLTAVLLDREAISLRLVALAAWLVLLLEPQAAIMPGFQMSFAATAALVAAFTELRSRGLSLATVWDRVKAWIIGLFLANAVAGAATGLVAMHHFERTAIYGFLGNLIGGPIAGFAILPAGLVACLLAPIGLDQPAFFVMGAACEVVIEWARSIASWPGALVHPPSGSTLAMTVGFAALMTLCLVRGPLRSLAVMPGGVAAALWLTAPQPVALVGEEGLPIAVATQDGLALSGAEGQSFTVGVWLESEGQTVEEAADVWTRTARCDGQGCTLRAKGDVLIALADRLSAVDGDCRRADAVIASELYVPANLKARCPVPLVDRAGLWSTGSVALLAKGGAVTVQAARDARRPWSP
jgi:competence protein ComEC